LKPVLTVKDLCFATPSGRPLVESLSLTLSTGEILLLSGANGTGKSSFLKIVTGQNRFFTGEVWPSKKELRFSYLPQMANTSFHVPLQLRDVIALERAPLEDDDALACGLLKRHELALCWNTASGGERQKALLTKVFLQNSDLLILDEPMNHLEGKAQLAVCRLIAEYVASQDKAVLLVAHEGEHRLDLPQVALRRLQFGEGD